MRCALGGSVSWSLGSRPLPRSLSVSPTWRLPCSRRPKASIRRAGTPRTCWCWTEFAARGLTPMRDFWYPYGNEVVFESGLVTGPALLGMFQLALLAAYWWIFWNSAGRRLLASSLALLALLAVQPVVGEFFRYGLGLAIALAYTCIDPNRPAAAPPRRPAGVRGPRHAGLASRPDPRRLWRRRRGGVARRRHRTRLASWLPVVGEKARRRLRCSACRVRCWRSWWRDFAASSEDWSISTRR